ncbi:MAG: hypothetical protein AABX13_06140 [Nanoarchaeota archaeon]
MKQKIKQQAKRYRHQHWLDKSLDMVLVSGVLLGLALFALEITMHPGEKFQRFIRTFDILFVGIMFTDMGRNFAKSRDFLVFVKHHWLDLVILTVVIVSFSSVLYLGAGRLSWLIREERLLVDAGRIAEVGFLRRLFR